MSGRVCHCSWLSFPVAFLVMASFLWYWRCYLAVSRLGGVFANESQTGKGFPERTGLSLAGALVVEIIAATTTTPQLRWLVPVSWILRFDLSPPLGPHDVFLIRLPLDDIGRVTDLLARLGIDPKPPVERGKVRCGCGFS